MAGLVLHTCRTHVDPRPFTLLQLSPPVIFDQQPEGSPPCRPLGGPADAASTVLGARRREARAT